MEKVKAGVLQGLVVISAVLVHSVVVVALSLLLIFAMDSDFYQNWFGFLAISGIPALVIINAVWQFEYPHFCARVNSQPSRGLVFVALAILLGLAVAFLSLWTVGTGITPPPPFLMMFIILSVVVVMWLLLVFEGWPFSALDRSMQGWMMLVSSYLLAFAIYWLLFDFSRLPGLPETWLQIAPHGLFEPWLAIVYSITTLGVLFAFQLLEFRPFCLLKSTTGMLSRQPWYGLVVGTAVLLLAWLILLSVTRYGGMNAVNFMVKGPVSFLFGLFLIMDTTGGRLFISISQPIRGVLLIVLSALTGMLMCYGYNWFMQQIAEGYTSGAPGYAAELWLANAMLSMTFPLILIYCHYFNYWPLTRLIREDAAE